MLTSEQINKIAEALEADHRVSISKLARIAGTSRLSIELELARSGKRIEKRLVNIRPKSTSRQSNEQVAV